MSIKLLPLEALHAAWQDKDMRTALDPDSMNRRELPDKESPFNKERDEIMDYINKHKNMLSLPCDGNCYSHTDGVVVFCYQKLMEVKNA